MSDLHSRSQTSVPFTDADPTGPLPRTAEEDLAEAGEDVLFAESTGEFPELGDIGDDDIIADGGTQIMTREPTHLPLRAVGHACGGSSIPSPVAPATAEKTVLSSGTPDKHESNTPPSAKPAKPPVPSARPPVPSAPPMSLDAFAATIQAAPNTIAGAPSAKAPAEPPNAPSKLTIPPAPDTAPLVELDADDLEEEQRRIDRTQPFDRARIFGAPPPAEPVAPLAPAQASAATWQPTALPRLALALSPTPPPASVRHHTPSLPAVVVNDLPQGRPTSLAPLALDVTSPLRPDATLKLPPVLHIPKNNTPILVAAIVGGLALCAAAIVTIGAVTSASSDPATSTKGTPAIAVKPREAQKGTARSAVIETPETTPAKAAALLPARDEDGTPVSSPGALPSAPGSPLPGSVAHSATMEGSPAPAPRAASTPRASAAARPAASATQPAPTVEPTPPPVVAAPPPPPPAPARPAGPAPTTGTIEVPASLMTVMVDGDYRRVQGGRIVVTCGKHKVNAGRGTQIVDVPCGGVASVM